MSIRYLDVADNAQCLLVGAHSAGAVNLTVDDASVFDGVEFPFVVTLADPIGDTNRERVLVLGITGNVLEVERGYDGDIPTSHSHDSLVSLRTLAKHVRDLNANAVMQVQSASYLEHTRNGTGQITQTNIWEDNTKVKKLVMVTYVYANTATQSPTTATRVIYKDDGATAKRTETCTFTYTSTGKMATIDRVIT